MTPNDLVRNQSRDLMRFLGRHIVALGIRYIALDDSGKHTGPERISIASGFVMEFGNQWFFVTAGHVFQDIANHRRDRELELVSASLIAFFNHENRSTCVIPIDYDSMEMDFVNDRDWGLDVGLIRLSELFRRQLEGNNVCAITEEQWRYLHRVECEAFVMIGFPWHMVQGELPADRYGDELRVTMDSVLIPVVRRETLPPGSPDSVLPYFIGEMPQHSLNFDICGMSGCPIFGFRRDENGNFRYWIVALQSRRSEVQREMILACPTHIFAPIIERALAADPPSEGTGDC